MGDPAVEVTRHNEDALKQHSTSSGVSLCELVLLRKGQVYWVYCVRPAQAESHKDPYITPLSHSPISTQLTINRIHPPTFLVSHSHSHLSILFLLPSCSIVDCYHGRSRYD